MSISLTLNHEFLPLLTSSFAQLVAWPAPLQRFLCPPPRALFLPRLQTIGADVEKRLEVAAIAGLTTGEMKGNWQATEIGLQVNLG
jgi:hypothetical protein